MASVDPKDKPYQVVKGRGFIQPNALLKAPEATSGVVLTAHGTMKITDGGSGAASSGTGTNDRSMASFSSLANSAAASGGIRRGRGANTASSVPAGPTTTTVKKAQARKDIVTLAYGNRVWRNIVMQYTAPSNATGEKLSGGPMVDPTPLSILGCAVPTVAGVKGVEYYYDPKYGTAAASAGSSSKKASGPYVASVHDLFAAAVGSYNARMGVGQSALSLPTETLTDGAEAEEKALLSKHAEAEAKEMKYKQHTSMLRDSDDDDAYSDEDGDSDFDGGREGAKGADDEEPLGRPNSIVTLPMLRPPIARTATPSVAKVGGASSTHATAATEPKTVDMMMSHTISGTSKFKYTDHDGVMSSAVIPVIGGTVAATTAAAAGAGDDKNSRTANPNDDDDDEAEVICMDGVDGTDKTVSAYLNPKAKANRQYFVRKADLSDEDRQIFDKLWTIWRKSYTPPSGKGAVGGATASINASISGEGGWKSAGKKRVREEDIPFIKNGDETSATREGRDGSNQDNATTVGGGLTAAIELSEEDEIARMIRATEEELAALQRDLY